MPDTQQNKSKNIEDTPKKREGTGKTKTGFLSRYWTVIVLFFFIALFIWQDVYFVLNNQAPPYGDSQFHLTTARREFRMLFEGGKESRLFYSAHPPLVYLTTDLLFLITKPSIKAALLSLLIYSLIFVLSVYAIGTELGGKEGGIASALIVLSCHYFLQLSHVYLLDMPQAAFTALAVYLLFKSEMFSDFTYSILFGVALSLIMFVKWTGIFYLAPALVIIFVYLSYRNLKTALMVIIPFIVIIAVIIAYYITGQIPPGEGRIVEGRALLIYFPLFLVMLGGAFFLRKKLKDFLPADLTENGMQVLNGITAILLCAVINTPWYVYSQCPIVTKIQGQKTEMAMRASQFQESVMLFNLKTCLNAYKLVFPLFLIFALIGIIFIFFKREKRFELALLLFMAFSGVLSLLPSAMLSIPYIITLLAFIAILGGYWVNYTGKFKYVILASIFTYSFISLAYPLPFGETGRNLGAIHYKTLSFAFNDRLIPDKEEYYTGASVSDLKKDLDKPGQKADEKRIPVAVEVSDSFMNPPQEKRMQQIEPLIFQTLSWYQGFGQKMEFILFENWRGLIDDYKDLPFYIFLCYTEDSTPGEAEDFLKYTKGRNVEKLSLYQLKDGRKILLLKVAPEKRD